MNIAISVSHCNVIFVFPYRSALSVNHRKWLGFGSKRCPCGSAVARATCRPLPTLPPQGIDPTRRFSVVPGTRVDKHAEKATGISHKVMQLRGEHAGLSCLYTQRFTLTKRHGTLVKYYCASRNQGWGGETCWNGRCAKSVRCPHARLAQVVWSVESWSYGSDDAWTLCHVLGGLFHAQRHHYRQSIVLLDSVWIRHISKHCNPQQSLMRE